MEELDKQQEKELLDSEKIKQLCLHSGFEVLIKKLAQRINSLDTVRNIDAKKTEGQIAADQLARFYAITIIENWLDDILALKNLSQIAEQVSFEEESIYKTLIEKDE